MTLTVHSTLSAALLAKGCHPFLIVDIFARTDAGAAATFSYSSRHDLGPTVLGYPLYYPQCLVGITPVERSIDPITRRASSTDEMSVQLDDPGTGSEVRQLLSGYRVAGHPVTIKLMADNMSAANALTVWSGIVEEIEPAGYTSITLRCVSTSSVVLDREVTGSWFFLHPLERALAALQAAGVEAAAIDSASFAYDADSDLAHLVSHHPESMLTGGETWQTWTNPAGRAWVGTYTVVNYAALSGATVTVTIDGVDTVRTEGVHWTAATSNNATAISLATAIDALANVGATPSGAVVSVSRDATGGTAGLRYIHLATNGGINLVASETDFNQYFADWKVKGLEREHGDSAVGWRNAMYPWVDDNQRYARLAATVSGVEVLLPRESAGSTSITDAVPLASDRSSTVDDDTSTGIAGVSAQLGVDGTVTQKSGLRPFDKCSYYIVFGCPVFPPAVPLRDILDEVSLVTGGSVLFDEATGKWSFVPDPTGGSAVAAWTKNDVHDLQQLETFGNAVNRCVVTQHWRVHRHRVPDGCSSSAGNVYDVFSEIEDLEYQYVAENTTAQAKFGPDGTTLRPLELALTLNQFSGYHTLDTALTAVGTAVSMGASDSEPYGQWARPYGMSGMSSISGHASAALSAARVAYLLIGDEILTCNASGALTQTQTVRVPTYDKSTYSDLPDYVSVDWTANARGQKGTTAAAHPVGALIRDITPAVLVGDRIVARAAYGLPILECRTEIDQIAIEVGELVTLTHDAFIGYALDGITSAKTLEITGKRLELLGDSINITWTLAMVSPA